MKINGMAVPAAFIAIVLAGAIAWGDQHATVGDHDRRIEDLEKTPLAIQGIEKDVMAIQKDVGALQREQRTFSRHAEKQLDRILRKLDQVRP